MKPKTNGTKRAENRDSSGWEILIGVFAAIYSLGLVFSFLYGLMDGSDGYREPCKADKHYKSVFPSYHIGCWLTKTNPAPEPKSDNKWTIDDYCSWRSGVDRLVVFADKTGHLYCRDGVVEVVVHNLSISVIETEDKK